MSIFKESFRDYVKKQFDIRQKVISSGNSDKDSPSRLYHGFDNLAPGAFYGYQQKQCVIRMASLVDLMKNINLGLGVTQPDGTRYVSPFSSYKGSTFSRNYVLEGGVLSDYARNIAETDDGLEVKVRKVDVRGGFPKPGKRVNLSYGDPSLVADPTIDGYGVVPMPGITDANIRTKSAYGSLREAKVNFVCHNLKQLEILELLYMRPGYPVLMEWGWSPHINNDGEISNDFPSVSDYEEFWNDNLVSQEWIQSNIIRLKKQYNGNYDGFIGFVSNFNYEARPDGGFNCTTELISMGEVISSLKVPSVSFSTIDDSDLEEDEKKELAYQNSLGVIIQKLYKTLYQEETTQHSNNVVSAARSQEDGENVEWALQYRTDQLAQLSFAVKELVDLLGSEVSDQVLLKKGTTITDGNGQEITIDEGYVRWDGFADLINKVVIPRNEKNQPPLIISNTLNPNITTANEVKPILYAKYVDQNDSILDVSCDPKVCILPHQFNDFQDDDINLTFNQKISLFFELPFGVAWSIASNAESPTSNTFNNLLITQETAERRIGGIYISINHIKKIFENTFTNNRNASLGDFLKNLWDSINNVCPLHNFTIRNDFENTNVVQIIDLPISSDDLNELNYDELFKFNVLSNDTIVRDFRYNTQIPSALKATIAINAQSGATSDDLESVTFAAFNEAIKSRLHSFSEKFSDEEIERYDKIQKTREEKETKLFEIRETLNEYKRDFFNLIETNENNLKNLKSKYGSVKSLIKNAQSLENYLEKSSSGYLKNQSVIPLNLNLVLDGISGVVIGNVFRVDEFRLPRAYRKGNVAFVVLGEEQNITAGQDWTTNLRGQLILFPTEEETSNKGQNRTSDDDTRARAAAAAAEAARQKAEEAARQAEEARKLLFTGELVDTYTGYFIYNRNKGITVNLSIEIFKNNVDKFFVKENQFYTSGAGGSDGYVTIEGLRTDLVYDSLSEVRGILDKYVNKQNVSSERE